MAEANACNSPRYSSGFQEHQRELCHLSAFIKEQEQWLDTLLGQLGWSREELGAKNLVQCPVNKSHYVSMATLEQHKQRCQYAALGVDVEEIPSSPVGFYEQASSACVKISPSIERAIRRHVADTEDKEKSAAATFSTTYSSQRDFIDRSEVIVESHDSLVMQEHFASLEDTSSAPREILSQEPAQIIRYIKSWRLVPFNFTSFPVSFIPPAKVKAWLFAHLPTPHVYSAQISGELQAVDAVMQVLCASGAGGGGGGAEEGAQLKVDSVMTVLRPMLEFKTRPFVLELWKFLHISRIQNEHSIPDSFMEELTPLPLIAGRRESGRMEAEERLVKKIKALAEEEEEGPGESRSGSPPLPLPMAAVQLSAAERLTMHSYVMGVAGRPGIGADKSLFWDSSLTGGGAGQNGPGGKSYLEVLKEERDHRRRRKSYRAKNTHITRRRQTEVVRDFIDARMDDIRAALEETVSPDGDKEEEEEQHDAEGRRQGYRSGKSPSRTEAAREDDPLGRREKQEMHGHGERYREKHHTRGSLRESDSKHRTVERDRRSLEKERGMGLEERKRTRERSAERDKDRKRTKERDKRRSRNEADHKSGNGHEKERSENTGKEIRGGKDTSRSSRSPLHSGDKPSKQKHKPSRGSNKHKHRTHRSRSHSVDRTHRKKRRYSSTSPYSSRSPSQEHQRHKHRSKH